VKVQFLRSKSSGNYYGKPLISHVIAGEKSPLRRPCTYGWPCMCMTTQTCTLMLGRATVMFCAFRITFTWNIRCKFRHGVWREGRHPVPCIPSVWNSPLCEIASWNVLGSFCHFHHADSVVSSKAWAWPKTLPKTLLTSAENVSLSFIDFRVLRNLPVSGLTKKLIYRDRNRMDEHYNVAVM